MTTIFATALLDASADWGTTQFTGPTLFAAAISKLELDSGLKTRLDVLLSPWNNFVLEIVVQPSVSVAAWLKQCKVMVAGSTVSGGAIKTDAKTAQFWEALIAADALIQNKGVVRQWGEATCTKNYRYIAKKFMTDHLVDDKKGGAAHAKGRLSENAKVPASTAIENIYAPGLSEFVGKINEAGIFQVIERYLNRVKGWDASSASIDSIVWLTSTKLTAFTFKRPAPGKNLTAEKQSGYLAFSVQPEENSPETRLLYHFAGIDANPRARVAPWELLSAETVLAKVDKLEGSQRAAMISAWPVVYFSAKA